MNNTEEAVPPLGVRLERRVMPLLLHGDCLDLMYLIPDGSVDAIICDLPYGTTACKWDTVIPFDALWTHYKRVIKPNGAIVLFGSQPFTSALVMSNPKMFKYELIWEKSQGTSPGVAKFRPMPAHENLLVFGRGTTTYNPEMRTGFKPWTKKDKKYNGPNEHGYGYSAEITKTGGDTRYPLSYLNITQEKGWGGQQHPTQKPVALLEYLIRTYTNEGETVLDNCMGSGTTGVGCLNTGRNFIGIEKDAGYFEIARNRIMGHNVIYTP